MTAKHIQDLKSDLEVTFHDAWENIEKTSMPDHSVLPVGTTKVLVRQTLWPWFLALKTVVLRDVEALKEKLEAVCDVCGFDAWGNINNLNTCECCGAAVCDECTSNLCEDADLCVECAEQLREEGKTDETSSEDVLLSCSDNA